MAEQMDNRYTPNIPKLAKICVEHNTIEKELYAKYKVNRGLRDVNGKGVLTGLTEISDIISWEEDENGNRNFIDGQLYYRGVKIEDIVNGFVNENRFGFEEVVYLLIFGSLPNAETLNNFKAMLADCRDLPIGFVRDIILKAPSSNMMNTMAKSVLSMYAFDENPDDVSVENVLRQSLQLISVFPLMAVYGYQAYNHYYNGESLVIHKVDKELSIAQLILHLLRADSEYTDLEAKILDIALVLHAEHGGGNNSSFTTHVVTSSGTDTYSTIAASLGSLKGPKHGGANIKVMQMFDDLKANVSNWEDEGQITDYLLKLLNKEAFDKSGLIYGMGHAIYALSDPRARVFKGFVKSLAEEKGLQEEFMLYDRVERIAANVISEKRKIYKGVSANVDFYSGFVYNMLKLPYQLYTPMFAVSRIAGWSAHRLEEIINAGKIIRPAYMGVGEHKEYVPLKNR
ncbi:MAG: citrate/2-methylcitrate synthase [Clostridia bacterium]|nr:citrate/2-methylcitrate synthase [Clostridia bacterium]